MLPTAFFDDDDDDDLDVDSQFHRTSIAGASGAFGAASGNHAGGSSSVTDIWGSQSSSPGFVSLGNDVDSQFQGQAGAPAVFGGDVGFAHTHHSTRTQSSPAYSDAGGSSAFGGGSSMFGSSGAMAMDSSGVSNGASVGGGSLGMSPWGMRATDMDGDGSSSAVGSPFDAPIGGGNVATGSGQFGGTSIFGEHGSEGSVAAGVGGRWPPRTNMETVMDGEPTRTPTGPERYGMPARD